MTVGHLDSPKKRPSEISTKRTGCQTKYVEFTRTGGRGSNNAPRKKSEKLKKIKKKKKINYKNPPTPFH